jgi:hypothetical protein
MTTHAIRCRRTGEVLAILLDGGRACFCPTDADCALLRRDPLPPSQREREEEEEEDENEQT